MQARSIKTFQEYLSDAIEATTKIIEICFTTAGEGVEQVLDEYRTKWGYPFDDKSFTTIQVEFDMELQNNIMQYPDDSMIMAYIESSFPIEDIMLNDPFYLTKNRGGTDEKIIQNGIELELILKLKLLISNAVSYINKIQSYHFIKDYRQALATNKPKRNNFDFETTKKIAGFKPTITEQITYLISQKYEFQQHLENIGFPHFGEVEDINYENKCDIEIEKLKEVAKVAQESQQIGGKGTNSREEAYITAKQVSNYRISDNKKTDFIKVISAMYDLRMFSTSDGHFASNKGELIKSLGRFFGEDIPNYSSLLANAKNTISYLDVFDDLKKRAEEYYDPQTPKKGKK